MSFNWPSHTTEEIAAVAKVEKDDEDVDILDNENDTNEDKSNDNE